jgi:hypothetical protein
MYMYMYIYMYIYIPRKLDQINADPKGNRYRLE